MIRVQLKNNKEWDITKDGLQNQTICSVFLTKNTPLVFEAVGTLVSVVPDSARMWRALL